MVTEHPAAGAASVVAVSIAAFVVAVCALEWHRVAVRTTSAALGAILALEAMSLALLELYVRDSAFDHGQVAMTGLGRSPASRRLLWGFAAGSSPLLAPD